MQISNFQKSETCLHQPQRVSWGRPLRCTQWRLRGASRSPLHHPPPPPRSPRRSLYFPRSPIASSGRAGLRRRTKEKSMSPRHVPPFLQGPSSRNIAWVEIDELQLKKMLAILSSSLLTCFSFRASMTLTTSLVVAGGFNSNLPNCAYISGL